MSNEGRRLVTTKEAIIAVCVIVGFGTCTRFVFETRSGTHESREEAGISGLPENAADINHWMKATFPNRVYDFRTDEQSFRIWRERFDYRDLKQQSLPFDVLCFDCESGKFVDHTIVDGIVYCWLQPSGDQSMTVAYDRELSRAYFHEATR